MNRIIPIYGIIAGAIVSALMLFNITLIPGEHGAGSQIFGFASMILAFGFVFVAVKQYRDQVKGGVIKFWPAFQVALGVTAVASVIYVITWEIYFNATGGVWIEEYIDGIIANEQAKGLAGDALEAFADRMRQSVQSYRNWWYRIPATFIEILPLGVVIDLIAAGLFRNANFLPKRG